MDKAIALIKGVIALLIPNLKSDGSVAGNKETKEALVGLNEVALLIGSRFKDGVQFSDFSAFFAALTADAEFKSKMEAAWEGHKSIPTEIKDLDVAEILELVEVQADYVPKLIESMKKEAPTA